MIVKVCDACHNRMNEGGPADLTVRLSPDLSIGWDLCPTCKAQALLLLRNILGGEGREVWRRVATGARPQPDARV